MIKARHCTRRELLACAAAWPLQAAAARLPASAPRPGTLVLQAEQGPRIGPEVPAAVFERCGPGRFLDLHRLHRLVHTHALSSLHTLLDAANHCLALELVRMQGGCVETDEPIDTATGRWYRLQAHWPLPKADTIHPMRPINEVS